MAESHARKTQPLRSATPSVPTRPVLVGAGVLLVAANLRPAITAVGPLLGDIRSSTGMSATAAGLLTALPLLAFSTMSLVVAPIGRRFGTERTLLAALLVLAAGLIVRSLGALPVIFAGTAVLGAAIALGNVLLPSLVKQDFPDRAGLMTGLYSTTLAGMAGVASAVSVLLAHDLGLGWRAALAAWAVFPLAGAIVWAPYVRGRQRVPQVPGADAAVRLRGSWLAWQVTLFMGLQSVLFYSFVTWLPTLVAEQGLSAAAGGWLLGLLQLASLVTTVAVPVVAGRRRNQHALVIACTFVTVVAVIGLWAIGADAPVVWVIPLGLGLGGLFGLSLLFLVIRARDTRATGALSGMAQAWGYGLAAVGPVGLGLLHDLTGAWDVGLAALLVVAVLTGAVGIGAARDATVP